MIESLLLTHIILGSIGLIVGSIVISKKKGDKWHKLLGRVFAISMLGAGVSSLILACIHPNNILFSIGVFTIYMVATAWRYLYLRNLRNGQRPMIIDYLLQLFMLIASVFFVVLSVQSFMNKQMFGFVLLAFAWRGFSFVYQDLKAYRGKVKADNYWLLFHLQRMIGAYIASVTAFAVVNFDDKFGIFPWVIPSLILVPFIFKWSKKYKKELPS